MSTNRLFKSKVGLIAATVGSAVGLGNIWRFPAETQANGGAAFLLLYICCIFMLGIPVMLAEFSLGRGGRSDSVTVFNKLSPGKSWWLVGAAGILASCLIACFYMVVEGWTLQYFWNSLTGDLYAGADLSNSAAADEFFTGKMTDYIFSPLQPVIFTALVILINLGVLMGGVQKGIERLSNVLMPVLFVVLVVLCCVTLSLPGASAGVEWFLSPDFSKITPMTVVNALGQCFFSLSLGMGILITYGAYYPSDTRLTRTSVIVACMTLLVALLVGFVIFPAVASFGLSDHSLRGVTLVFQTLPEVFARIPGTQLWSILFFFLLFAAALTSTVSSTEVIIAFLQDKFGMSRLKACCVALLPLLPCSALCSLSFSSLRGFTIFGLNLFDFLDTVSTNIMLPLVAIGVCVYIGWFAPRGLLKSQLSNEGTIRSRITGFVIFVVRYLAPVLIATILITNFI